MEKDPIPEKNPPAYNDESQGPSCPPNSQQTGYPQEPGQPTSYLQPAPGYPLKPVDGCPAESIKTYVPPPPGYSHSQNQGYVQQPGTNHVGSNSTRVVVTQPSTVTAVVMPPFNDNMVLSLFSCLCCCWILGVFAIVKSSEARNRYMAGDYDGAESSARSARNISIASITCGICILGVVIIRNFVLV